MTFLEHLEELRQALVKALAGLLIVSIICAFFSSRLLQLISDPIIKILPKDSSLVFTGLPDPFFIYVKVVILAAVIITLPWIIYQLWRFIRPGLHEHEKKYAIPFIIAATVLFYAGAAFAYFLVFPAAFKFFLSWGSEDLKPMIAIREYISLVILLMLAFGAVFETPIVIVFLGLLGVVNSSILKTGRRYFVVFSFVIAAILTPTPDVINQTMMAVPLLLFYEVGIYILVLIERQRSRNEALEQSQSD